MKTIFHSENSRGHANHGWLNAKHSFSFASWYNPERVHFGTLRVLNDDTVSPGMGFGTHPHDNMEIITIPLEGAIAHKDSMGNSSTIQTGEIQVMSAGTGIQHSEFNPNDDKDLKLFQIWLFPNKRNVAPRYDQQKITVDEHPNEFVQILSPNPKRKSEAASLVSRKGGRMEKLHTSLLLEGQTWLSSHSPPFPLKLLMEKMERADDASGLTNIRYRPRRIQQTRAEKKEEMVRRRRSAGS